MVCEFDRESLTPRKLDSKLLSPTDEPPVCPVQEENAINNTKVR